MPASHVKEYAGHVFDVRGWVDAQNMFGAKVRNNFFCRLQYDDSNNTWTCLALTLGDQTWISEKAKMKTVESRIVENDTGAIKASAWLAAEKYVRKRLARPDTADFRPKGKDPIDFDSAVEAGPNDTFTVRGYLEAQTVDGSPMRDEFRVVLKRTIAGEFQLQNLRLWRSPQPQATSAPASPG